MTIQLEESLGLFFFFTVIYAYSMIVCFLVPVKCCRYADV